MNSCRVYEENHYLIRELLTAYIKQWQTKVAKAFDALDSLMLNFAVIAGF